MLRGNVESSGFAVTCVYACSAVAIDILCRCGVATRSVAEFSHALEVNCTGKCHTTNSRAIKARGKALVVCDCDSRSSRCFAIKSHWRGFLPQLKSLESKN